MRHLRPDLNVLRLAALLLLVALVRGGAGMASVQDASPLDVAGVVVDYGDGRISYAVVPFEEGTISGFEMLRRSGLSLLSVEFGGMGEGVCAIEETGCDLAACRARLCQTGDPDSPFWHYVQSGGDGDWLPAPLGASSSQIEPGDVDGWFWTGAAPVAHAPTLEDIVSQTGVDLETYSASSGIMPEPIAVTTGVPANENALDQRSVLTGIAVVAGIAVLGGLLVVRSRKLPS